MSSPSMSTRPLSGTSSRRISLSVVLLPVPDSPTTTDRLALAGVERDVLEDRAVEGEVHVLELDDGLGSSPASSAVVPTRRVASAASSRARGADRLRRRRCGIAAALAARARPSAAASRASSRASSRHTCEHREQDLREEVVDDRGSGCSPCTTVRVVACPTPSVPPVVLRPK